MSTTAAFPTGPHDGPAEMPPEALAPGRLIKEQTHRLLHPRLVVLEYPEIVPTLLQHAQAQLSLGIEGVPGYRPPREIQVGQETGGQPHFTLLAILPAVYPPQGPAVYGNGSLPSPRHSCAQRPSTASKASTSNRRNT